MRLACTVISHACTRFSSLYPAFGAEIINNSHQKIVIIFGPTAVGKTDLSLAIAEHLNAEIINMDVGQFYEPLSIGTAKPLWRKEPIPHHLFDVIKTPEDHTVCAYRTQVGELISRMQQKGKTPLIVGGSGFYLQSLFFPPHNFQHNDFQRKPGDHSYSWEELYKIDPVRAQKISPHDSYRIDRALTIWYQTGILPSAFVPSYRPISKHAFIIKVSRAREDLYARINKRIQLMMEQGFLDEVRGLLDTPWEPFLKRKKLIGYDDLIDHLRDSMPKNISCVLERIDQKTRNYAKRQETLWRGFKKMLHQDAINTIYDYEVNLTTSDTHLYIESLLKALRTE